MARCSLPAYLFTIFSTRTWRAVQCAKHLPLTSLFRKNYNGHLSILACLKCKRIYAFGAGNLQNIGGELTAKFWSGPPAIFWWVSYLSSFVGGPTVKYWLVLSATFQEWAMCQIYDGSQFQIECSPLIG